MMAIYWQQTPVPFSFGHWVRTKAQALMDVILHLGAHRTASTSFQYYMRGHAQALGARNLAFWGPLRTRKGLFDGLTLPSGKFGVEKRRQRGVGRVRLALHRAKARGTRHLIVSDENMIGTVRENLSSERLYPSIGERMARFADAFDGRVTRVVLSVRALDAYWASALAFAVPRGVKTPEAAQLDRLVTQPRSWRAVITDLACAMPETQIVIAPFERMAGRPDDLLEYMLEGQIAAPARDADCWRNRAPELHALREVLADRGEDQNQLPMGEGRWMPFDRDQVLTLREVYADDMFWLRAGVDGLALLIEESGPDMAGLQPPAGPQIRGQGYDKQDQGLVRAR